MCRNRFQTQVAILFCAGAMFVAGCAPSYQERAAKNPEIQKQRKAAKMEVKKLSPEAQAKRDKLDRKRASDRIEQMGAVVVRDENYEVITVFFPNANALRGLRELHELTLVTQLDLTNSGLSDYNLESIRTLKQLEYLVLANCKITDKGLENLKELTELKTLNLSGTGITESGLAEVAKLSKLESLILNQLPIGDRGAGMLSELPQLTYLELSESKLTDAGLTQLINAHPKLKTLNLYGSSITDDGAKQLGKLTDLETLYLSGTPVTDETLATLAGLTAMKVLWLSETKVTDAGLQHLGGLVNLKQLAFSPMQISETAAADLQKKLPGCQILR